MSRATGYLGWMVLLLGLCALPAAGGSDECAAGPAGALVRQSVFAHGYLHGYEAGFQAGDLDFHSGQVRNPRDRREIDRLSGYQPTFGSRSSFTAGFRHGFLAGYEDSMSGRDFRGFKILGDAAGPADDDPRPADFDQGFRDGYNAGDSAGTADLQADSDFDPAQGLCPAKAAHDGSLPPSSQAYCAGYVDAYRVGYTDGFVMAPPSDRGAVVAAR